MEIVLAGTAARNNIPAFRCVCSVCAQARESHDRKLKRKNSCAVIIGNRGEKILIDTPPQFMNQLEQCGINDTEIDNILFTHGHGDHILGLFFALSVKKSKGAVIDSPLNIYMGKETLRAITSIFKIPAGDEKTKNLDDVIKLNTIEEHKEFNIGSISVTALETDHLNIRSSGMLLKKRDSFGYCLSEKGKNFYYFAAAAKKLPEETLGFMRRKRPDCIIIDCTYEKTDAMSDHGDIESVIGLRNMFLDGRIIISHIDHSNLTPVELSKIFDNEGIEIGYDGFKIQL